MHADELRMAVAKIVDIFNQSDIRAVVDHYRSAKGDQRTAAAARLGHAGAVIMERIDSLTASERLVVKCLHLESLGSAEYWKELLGGVSDPRKHQAEIVRLASRVMFASSHLPGMVALLDKVKPTTAQPNTFPIPAEGEGRLCIRLTDAGERASDPDRLARAIDGIDMLYSACASIARKPAIDLRLEGVIGKPNNDREIHFTGERDGMAAVYAVIDSIPAALADIDPEQDIDLDAVVQSLPIFEDLNTLASLGTFSKNDLKDISDTMHQGALLSLESGVILMGPEVTPGSGKVATTTEVTAPTAGAPVAAPITSKDVGTDDNRSAAERDEHYDRYLREREAMLQQSSSTGLNGHTISTLNADSGQGAVRSDDQTRRDAVDELLKSLGQSRSS